MLDAKSERVLADVVKQLRARFDTRLVAASLYGSATGPDFVPGVSDINVVIVLDTVNPTDLETLQGDVRRWRKVGLATPLVLDRAFLRTAADVFPMELEEIKDRHRPLFGEDVLATLTIRRDNLRYQCEHEARGKLLRLEGLFLEQGDNQRALRALIIDSLKTFLIVLRNVNRLVGVHAPGDSYAAVLQSGARHFDVEFPLMTQLLDIKLGRAQWPDDSDRVFRHYVEEVQRLVGLIDRLPADGSQMSR